MKKRFVSIIACLFVVVLASAQARKPTVMVVPSDAWCTQNGYVLEYDNQGIKTVVPNYKQALQSDVNLKLAIAKINDLMAEREFPLKDLEQTMKSVEQMTAEDNLTTSKGGAELTETPVDRLRRVAKADIIMELTWETHIVGPKTSITYILEGKDAYSGKSIGSSTATGNPSLTSDVPTLLSEAIVANIDNFNFRLQSYFDDMFEYGREVALEVRVFENEEGIDLETEYNGLELAEIIDEWMSQNTVGHRFSKLDGSETRLVYEQVRIPLLRENGTSMDTETFARALRKYLRGEPYKLTTKVYARGLGRAVVVIGGK